MKSAKGMAPAAAIRARSRSAVSDTLPVYPSTWLRTRRVLESRAANA